MTLGVGVPIPNRSLLGWKTHLEWIDRLDRDSHHTAMLLGCGVGTRGQPYSFGCDTPSQVLWSPQLCSECQNHHHCSLSVLY